MLQSTNEEEECLHGCVVLVLVETSTEKIEERFAGWKYRTLPLSQKKTGNI